MLLAEVLSDIEGLEIGEIPRVPITGIAYDSRKVAPGNLFVGMRGEKSDGSRFFRDAVRRGAVALVSEEEGGHIPGVVTLRVGDARKFLAQAACAFFENPSSRLKLAGITGTNGKTTTAFLVEAIYKQAGFKSCLAGTTGMRIGEGMRPSAHTTPEAPDLCRFLREAADKDCTHGVMEVSSHALALKRVFGLRFACGVFTNLTMDHLDFHRDMESYFRAKRMLFSPEGENRIEAAVINVDDPYGMRLAKDAGCRVVTYSASREADLRAVDCHFGTEGTKLVLESGAGRFEVSSRLVGRPNAENVLAAAAAAMSLGIERQAIVRGIESLTGVPGRMERIDAGQPFMVIVDYAHTPDALAKLLETVRRLIHGKLTTVFGCGGDRDRGKRPLMGEIAARVSDRVIATSDNPRSEDPGKILAEIEPGLRKGPAGYQLIADRRAAIAAALAQAGEGDAVVIAGKGHETIQAIGRETLPFDDREVAREAIAGLKSRRGEPH